MEVPDERLQHLAELSKRLRSPFAGHSRPMNPVHLLTIEADDGADVLFVCAVESCGRRLVVRRSGDLTVLDRGDFFALHVGGAAGVELATGLAQ